jgi:hypothetical protein
MKLIVVRGKDKSKTASPDTSKSPVTEIKGLPVRVTTYDGATRSHGAEAVVVLKANRIRSIVVTAGEVKLYLSPRAQFRVIEPEVPEERPAGEPLTLCAACRDGCHVMCENTDSEDDWCECVHSSHVVAGGVR